MGKKATKKSTRTRDRRVTVDAAFQQQLAHGEEPYAAVAELNDAILRGEQQLFVGGREEPIDPHWFADHARIAIRLVGGRATARVVSFSKGFKPAPPKQPYEWTMSEDGTASRPISRQRHMPGPKPLRNWQDHVLREIVRALANKHSIPAAPTLAQSCSDRVGYTPDVSAINKLIRDVLNEQ